MSAAYRSSGGADDDVGPRLAALEAQIADLRTLLAGTAGRSLDDRVTAIERLLVRVEAGLSAPRSAPTAAGPTADSGALDAKLTEVADSVEARIGDLTRDVDAGLGRMAERLDERLTAVEEAVAERGLAFESSLQDQRAALEALVARPDNTALPDDLATAEDVRALRSVVEGLAARPEAQPVPSGLTTVEDLQALRTWLKARFETLAQGEAVTALEDAVQPVGSLRSDLAEVRTDVTGLRRDLAAMGEAAERRQPVTHDDMRAFRRWLEEQLAGLPRAEALGQVRDVLADLVSVPESVGAVRREVDGLRRQVESLQALDIEGAIGARFDDVLEPLTGVRDLLDRRTRDLLTAGHMQDAVAPLWEGIASISEDVQGAREAVEAQKAALDEARDWVAAVEKATGELRAKLTGDEKSLEKIVASGVGDGLGAVLDEVRTMSSNYHRVATNLDEGIRRINRLGDEVVSALEQRDHLLQDEVVDRLVAALDRVVDLKGRNQRKVAKALAEAAADGTARGGSWEAPTAPEGPARITLRREPDARGGDGPAPGSGAPTAGPGGAPRGSEG